jgi:hypothetical protein
MIIIIIIVVVIIIIIIINNFPSNVGTMSYPFNIKVRKYI